MANLTLQREASTDQGTFGRVTDETGKQVCLTCERPDNGNQEMGCIPAGKYTVTQFDSPSKGRDFLLHNVPGRSMIEIHRGNTIHDTKGCILVGTQRGSIVGVPAVLNSALALGRMLEDYPHGFTLTIEGEK